MKTQKKSNLILIKRARSLLLTLFLISLCTKVFAESPLPTNELEAGCPIPTLEECMEQGYLEGELDGPLGCGALQGANDWTCSQLMQDEASQYQAKPSVFAPSLVESGIVASAGMVPQDPEDATATRFVGELTSPPNQFYGMSLLSDSQLNEKAIEDSRGSWPLNGEEFHWCKEYAHEKYFDVTNFWYEVGRDRHNYLRTFEIAFGPAGEDSSIGTHRLADEISEGEDFLDIKGNPVLPSGRQVHRNRFLDLPNPIVVVLPNGSPLQLGVDLGDSLREYSDAGETIVSAIESAGSVMVTKDMAFYKNHFDNLTVEGRRPSIGVWDVPMNGNNGNDDDDHELIAADDKTVIVEAEDDDGPAKKDPGGADELIPITGQVPLEFSGQKVMRRMFSTELNELYDLQRTKDLLVKQWFKIDKHYRGSGWTIFDLLDEMTLDLTTDIPDRDFGNDIEAFDKVQADNDGIGICCGDQPQNKAIEGDNEPPAGSDKVLVQLPSGTNSKLSPESAARKAVLDGLIDVYTKAMDVSLGVEGGCLGDAPTYCDFSVKEFALNAVTHAVNEQQDAYDECISLFPSPLHNNLGKTRVIIDPEADIAFIPEHERTFLDVEDDLYLAWLNLHDVYTCYAIVPDTLTATALEQIAETTEYCTSQIPVYKAALANFLEDYNEQKLKAEAMERLSQIPELIDPDTGEVKQPGISSSWDELKGSTYFGLDMHYQYAFEGNVAEEMCDFDIVAGGEFSASFKILTQSIPLIDVAAWAGTTGHEPDDEAVDFHAELLGVPLFTPIKKESLQVGDNVEIEFLEAGGSKGVAEGGAKFNFFIGPVPCSVEVGAGGEIGYEFNMVGDAALVEKNNDGAIDICPSVIVDGRLEPYVSVHGFMEVAIDVIIAEAGIRGSLLIVKAGVPVDIYARLEADDENEPIDLEFEIGMKVSASFETFFGNIEAYARLGPWDISKTILQWDGFRMEKELFSQGYSVSVRDLTAALGN